MQCALNVERSLSCRSCSSQETRHTPTRDASRESATVGTVHQKTESFHQSEWRLHGRFRCPTVVVPNTRQAPRGHRGGWRITTGTSLRRSVAKTLARHGTDCVGPLTNANPTTVWSIDGIGALQPRLEARHEWKLQPKCEKLSTSLIPPCMEER